MDRDRFVWGCALAFVVAAPAFGACLIDEEMGGDASRLVWCDGFDHYCVAVTEPWLGYPPFPPDLCPNVDATPEDHAEFLANWPKVHPPSGPVGDYQYLSRQREQAGRFSLLFEGNDHVAVRHKWVLTDPIHQKNPAHNAINGTDETPLVLKWSIHHGDIGAGANSPYYVELFLDGDRAPTDYVMVDCSPEEEGPYPVVCQQSRYWESSVNTICPPLDPTIHASLAAGFLAPLDPNPCNVETGRRPTRYHLVVFDGNQWFELRDNRYPPSIGDFGIGSSSDGRIWVKLEIKTSSIYVEYTNENKCPASFPCFANVPRQYLGPFNAIASGPGHGCLLDVNDDDGDGITNECAPGADYKTFDWPLTTENWFNSWTDTMVLYDGVTTSLSGACCLDDATCVETTQPDCENNLGGRFQGNDTLCADVTCCPYPFADGDMDGDVDQADFGLWQACYDGGNGLIAGCECYDRDGDNDVDGADFTEFGNCFTGANVPFDPQVQTACNPG